MPRRWRTKPSSAPARCSPTLEQRPDRAGGFYGVIALAYALGLLMVATMLVVSSRSHLGPFAASIGLRITGWTATAVMAAAALAMLAI